MAHCGPELEPRSFRYLPLDSQNCEVRLLSLEPAGTGPENGTLEGTFVQAFLTEATAPSYSTVSYCWGDASQRSSILLDGCSADVPLSSERALRTLRQHGKHVLWIDAVCINQADNKERSEQVAIMADIYRGAIANLVYLGDDGSILNNTVPDMRALLLEGSEDLKEHEKACRADKEAVMGSSDQPFATQFNMEDLIKLFDHSVFSRLWIMQEIALSQRNLVLAGNVSHDLQMILEVAVVLLRRDNYIPFRIPIRGLLTAAMVYELRLSPVNERTRTMDYLLRHTRSMEASIAKDHIFAILGVTQWSLAERSLPALLRTDYNKPLADVVRDATRMAIIELANNGSDRYLSPLSYVAHISNEELETQELPSWVPHWHESKRGEATEVTPVRDQPLAHVLPKIASPLVLGTPPDLQVLSVHGFQLDVVSETTNDPAFSTGIRYSSIKTFLDEAKSMYVHVAHHCSKEDSFVALSEVLLQGVRSAGLDGDADFFRQFESFYTFIEQRLASGVESDSKEFLAPHVGDVNFEYRRQFLRSCARRRFFVTSHGHFGIGPRTSKKGDIVVLLDGAARPFILRYIGQQYRLIGAAYMCRQKLNVAVQHILQEGRIHKVFEII